MDPNLDKLIRREFGLGAAEQPQSVYHARDPRLPQFAFEFHVGSQRVYRMDNPGRWQEGCWVPAPSGSVRAGHCIAEHCLTHGMFVGFVQTFCRAYLLACKHQSVGILHHLAPERIMAKETDPCPIR